MTLAILSCSLHPESRSRILALAAAERLQEAGAATELIDLAEWDLPFCDGDHCYDDPNVQELTRKLIRARGILIATPVYNYNVNAAAKNIVELTGSDAWEGKIVGFLCAAGGKTSYASIMPFASSLMLDFRCLIIPRFVYAIGEDFRGNEIHSPTIHERLDEITDEMLRLVCALEPGE